MKLPTFPLKAACLAALAATAMFPVQAMADGVVNIYTYRQPELIQPVLDAFTAETGIETQVLFLDKGLEERIAAEGQNSPADLIMTVDIARLTAAKEKGITQALDDAIVNGNLPAEYRDPEGHWFGLTKRGRVVYASKDRVTDTALSYADLADPKWKGRICVRSGQHDYNLALFSAMIEHWGAEKDWGNAINVIFPTFENGGTHVNISGAALARHSPNRDNAVKLLEFLSSHEAQQIYAEKNFEYPVEPGLAPSEIVKSFGTLNADTLPLADIAKHRKAASEMVDRVGLNDGPSS